MSFSPPITWVRVSVPMKSVWPRMIRLMPFGNSPFQDLGDQGRARADSGQKRIRKIGGLVLARSSVVTISARLCNCDARSADVSCPHVVRMPKHAAIDVAPLSPAGTKKLVFCLFDLLEPVRIIDSGNFASSLSSEYAICFSTLADCLVSSRRRMRRQ